MEQITTVPWAYFRAHRKVLQFSCMDVRLAVLGRWMQGQAWSVAQGAQRDAIA